MLWHGGLTNAQSANIERVKKRAFRRILPGVEYFVASNHLKMQTLSERRENHCIDLIANLCSTYFNNRHKNIQGEKYAMQHACAMHLLI